MSLLVVNVSEKTVWELMFLGPLTVATIFWIELEQLTVPRRENSLPSCSVPLGRLAPEMEQVTLLEASCRCMFPSSTYEPFSSV